MILKIKFIYTFFIRSFKLIKCELFLVEDNQMLAEGIQKILLDEGHSVDYFVDGELS